MSYALEATKEVLKKAPMSSRMTQINVLKEQMDKMKDTLVEVQFNERMPFVIKTQKIAEMKQALLSVMLKYQELLEEELNVSGEDGDT